MSQRVGGDILPSGHGLHIALYTIDSCYSRQGFEATSFVLLDEDGVFIYRLLWPSFVQICVHDHLRIGNEGYCTSLASLTAADGCIPFLPVQISRC